MGSSGNCVVAEGVVIEILSRLPVKSLLRFKCVCKFWYTLIQTPNFIRNHLMHNQNAKSNLLVHHYIPGIHKCRIAMFSDETLPPPVHDYIEIPPILNGMLGPVNGLFLLHSRKLMALWNPATREIRALPPPTTNLPPHITYMTHAFGFGLDPLTNDYKVVWIPFMLDTKLHVDVDVDPIIALYTLGNDSWTYLNHHPVSEDSICDIVMTIPDCKSTTYLNGAYFWLSSHNRIVVFDMSSDVFKEIQGPGELAPKHQELVVMHNNCLVVLQHKHSHGIGRFIDIWVMMQQEGCWTKHITLGPLVDIMGPLGVTMNDELFLETSSSQLVLYNPCTGGIRYVGIQGSKGQCCFLFSSYKESLVSVKGGSWDWDEHDLFGTLRDLFESILVVRTGSGNLNE